MHKGIRQHVLRGLAAVAVACCAQGALAQSSYYYAQAGIEPWLVDSAVPPSAGSYYTGSQGWQPQINLAVGYDSGALPGGPALRGHVLSQADLAAGTFLSVIHTDYREGAGVLGGVSLGQYVDTLTFSAGPGATAATVTKVIITLDATHRVWATGSGPASTYSSDSLSLRTFDGTGTANHGYSVIQSTNCDSEQCWGSYQEPWGTLDTTVFEGNGGGTSSGPEGTREVISIAVNLQGAAPVLELGLSWLDYLAGLPGDLAHVSLLSIQAPAGVSWTSQSGQLLAGLEVRAVPEPAGWELGVAGLLALAWGARRRVAQVPFA